MFEETKERIAERTAAANEQLPQQGWYGRLKTRLGLGVANTIDRVQAPAESNPGLFSRGALQGAFRGAGLGALVWPVLFGGFGVLAGVSGFLTVVAIGAAVGGLIMGRSSQNGQAEPEHRKRNSDRVAEAFGIVPGKNQNQGPTPRQQAFEEYENQVAEENYFRRWEEERRRHRDGSHSR